jgi:hypothetical protein
MNSTRRGGVSQLMKVEGARIRSNRTRTTKTPHYQTNWRLSDAYTEKWFDPWSPLASYSGGGILFKVIILRRLERLSSCTK